MQGIYAVIASPTSLGFEMIGSTVGVFIRNPDVERAAREVARLAGLKLGDWFAYALDRRHDAPGSR